MYESFNALACGAVKITPAKFSWVLENGKSCVARLLSGTVREVLLSKSVDTYVDLAIALPAMQTHISFHLCHVWKNDEQYSIVSITTTETKEPFNYDYDYDTHRQNIESVLGLLKIPLRHVSVSVEESYMDDEDFGFAWIIV